MREINENKMKVKAMKYKRLMTDRLMIPKMSVVFFSLSWHFINQTTKHESNQKIMLMKVLSHPGHGNLKCCIVSNWTAILLHQK